jgi:type I restriction enzyme, S subunit
MTQYKPYPVYKDSGVEWIGRVPEHWAMAKVAWDMPFSVGWTPATGNEDYYEGDFYWANIADLKQRTITETQKTITLAAVADRGATPVEQGSLLFSFKLSVGAVAFAGRPMFTNEAIAAFRPGAKIDLEFLYYAAPFFVPKFGRENIYGALLLNQELISSSRTFLPPLPEQRLIAKFLDRETARIDALIKKKQRLIELLKEKRQAVITRAVTKGLNPKVPEHWVKKRLKHISPKQSVGVVVNPTTYVDDSGTVPFLYGANIKEFEIDFDNARRISEESNALLAKSRLRSGDLVSVRVGEPGITAVIPPERDGCNCASVMFVRRSEYFDSAWLCYVMNSRTGRYQVEVVQYGAAQKQFNIEHAVEFGYPVPPMSEQRDIACYLDRTLGNIGSTIEKTARSILLLKEHRSALITAAVTGQIDVRDAA